MKKRSRIWQPWFLALVLAVGFFATWALIFTFTATLFQFHDSWQHKDVALLPDETLAVVSQSAYGGINYETLDGKPLEEPKSYLRSTLYHRNVNPSSPWNRPRWQERLVAFSDAPLRPTIFWYLVYDGEIDGHAYFVGYDIKSRRLVGYLGKNGFERELPALDNCFAINGRRGLHGQFSGSENNRSCRVTRSYWFNGSFENRGPCNVVYLLSDDKLLKIDLHDRSIRVLCDLPGVQTIEGVGAPQQTLPKKSPQRKAFGNTMFAARTNSEVLFLDSMGKEIRRWVIPKSLRNEGFHFTPLNETTGVAIFRRHLHRRPVNQYHFVWIDNQGTILRKEAPELPSYESWQNSPWFSVVAAPVPALLALGSILDTTNEYLASGESTDWPSALAAALAKLWLPIVVLLLLSIVLACFCYRRQKRYDQRWTWGWVIFIVLFGVPAMVGYWFHRRWPAIEPCPNCKQEAPRDRPACYACGEDFPRPAMKGTEVYV